MQMTTTRTAPYVVVPASPVLGAEIVGLDLANGVDEATADALREDFWRYKVLVFRNQHLSPDAHVRAVRPPALAAPRRPQSIGLRLRSGKGARRVGVARGWHVAQPTVQHRVAD